MTAMLSPTRSISGTPAAVRAITDAGQGPREFLDRHFSGDWGDLDEHDTRANAIAVLDGSRILSAYKTRLGVKIWIITDAENDDRERENTVILLPEEY